MVRNILFPDSGDIPVDLVAAGEVRGIRALRVTVPFAGKDAPAADLVKRSANSTDAGEQINEIEIASSAQGQLQREKSLQCMNQIGRRLILANLPASDSTHVDVQVPRD